MRRQYRISENTIKELSSAGLGEVVITALQHHVGRTYRRDEMKAHLTQIGPKPLEKKECALVMQVSRLSWLRLERFIPDRGLREWIEALIVALLIAATVRTFLFTPFKIPSGSMEPTILTGDQVFATRYNYGITVPFTNIKLFPSDVERGDIIIFPFPEDPSLNFIKRVVAIGGDQIEIKGTDVYINDQKIAEPYAYYAKSTLKQLASRGLTPRSHEPLQIPKDHLFVMGDNRFNSNDSRGWGFVNQDSVTGKARWVFWSHDPSAGWFAGYRLNRIGHSLQ